MGNKRKAGPSSAEADRRKKKSKKGRPSNGEASRGSKEKPTKRDRGRPRKSGGGGEGEPSPAKSSASSSSRATSVSTSASASPIKTPKKELGRSSPVKNEPTVDPRKGYMLPLKKINQHITCPICKGYLVDATTITECLHTFCKRCLLAHFEDVSNNCPKCDQVVHQSHPTHYVAFDRTMQDIVYKLVPGLQNEEKRRKTEYRSAKRKAAGKKERPVVEANKEEEKATNRCYPGLAPSNSHHRGDDQLVVRLVPDKGLEPISRPVVRTSHQTTINTLKRYLARMYWNDPSQYSKLDFYCNGELMGKDYSMRFIAMTKWRHHKSNIPIVLTYRPHIGF